MKFKEVKGKVVLAVQKCKKRRVLEEWRVS